MYQDRVAYISELQSFVASTKERFDNLLQTINWTKESLLSDKDKLQDADSNPASYDPEKLGTAGAEEPKEEVTSENGQVNVLDMLYGTHRQSLNSGTGGTGRLYNDIVASLQAVETTAKKDKKNVKEEDKAAALVQLLKMERDAKRRRISYKNKVHTKNKSHMQVLREVLEEQMMTLTGQDDEHSNTKSNSEQPSTKASELIPLQPPQGNPHLAWLTVIKELEAGKQPGGQHPTTSQQIKPQLPRPDHSRHHKHSNIHKYRWKDFHDDRERRPYKKDDVWSDRKRKESDYRKDEERYRGKEEHNRDNEEVHKEKGKKKRNDLEEIGHVRSPDNLERHHRKKKKHKRSRSLSHSDGGSDHKKHKSKHKKKKH